MTMRRRLPGMTVVALAVAALGSCMSSLPFGGCKAETPRDLGTLPDSFVVAFETSRGRFDVMARKSWAPLAAARFHELVAARYFDDVRFFRVIKGFVAQFGISGDPKISAAWRRRCIADEPVRHTNARGTLAYGEAGPSTRSVQMFINLADNPDLDSAGVGFPPFAEVVSGMSVVDSLYAGYGDMAPRSGTQYGREGPSQDSMFRKGNAYVVPGWPKLDYVKTARIVQEWRAGMTTTPAR
jgi:peptidyl-prolyl cis-trans isomerase A (cyclophilin A)